MVIENVNVIIYITLTYYVPIVNYYKIFYEELNIPLLIFTKRDILNRI